ncbi:6-phosphogluconolactonase-like protein [Suhomyces tanzawaensis NRRL Y-17324]|uniref:6-phosphogluconolactonase-like protein n=1 Tax=Suhomyces tanzawaensis NRRL Y-17324 TaxID=984487 RepID=A0A1E4SKR4_9ASCO|nr:6-phosphogluconolactonase-like protein [Suhomyces tanzawaensis NRRL Y-17324]ODV80105.1 6-phosphogluconolactonase-like protein [Suhomyces tanzawaensis NRRL Y-17324]
MPSVYAYSESTDVANSVGSHVLALQNASLKRGSTFKIALSGGSLGKVLKKALIDNPEIAQQVKWDQWEVYFSDERLVPLDHPDSNYGLFNELVLANLPAGTPKPKVNTINTDLLTGQDGQVSGADAAKDAEIAKDYEAKLPKDVKLDLVLLGCGPDGHTCSLFPGHQLLNERNQLIAYISDSPKPPPRRITFTFPVLEKATSIAFVAEGAGKAAILKDIFNDPSSKLPSKLVNQIKGVDVAWFVDTSAIEGVDIVPSKY